MEAYPPEYFTTPLPLLILSGLGKTDDYTELPPYPSLENGTLISSELAPVTSNIGLQLLEQFKGFSGQEKWVGTLKRGGRPPNSPSFKIIAVGRNFVLPPKKASPPPPSTPVSPFIDHSGAGVSTMLHSPISPLTPESPLFPDGIFTHIWLRKHLSLLPCAFVSVHEFHIANPPSSTEEDAADNVLINSINEMRKNLAADHRKAKFAVILISPKSILEAPSIEDRFSHIRRLTQLDTKTSLFFVPPGLSVVELQQFAKTVEMALVPSAIDYYRELTKHARRKRNRGSVPPPTLPPTASAQSLTNVEWTVRYEIKLAMFAEFRGEMDIAARNYETAYEGLMEVFETTNSWSTRWNDARVLADVVAAKAIRCHIFLENTTLAARRWAVHKKRMGDVVDRKGAGTNTYGWAAWSTRWAEIMATMVADAGILSARNSDMTLFPIYAPVDKTIKIDDRVAPIEFLHHPGFYWLMSANAAKLRRRRALRLAVSDTATESYMCPPPEEESHVDHLSLIIKPLEKALVEFDERKQHRMKGKLAFDAAVLQMEKQEWKSALQLLKGSLKYWRSELWLFSILQEALWRIRDCAIKCGDIASVVISDLELHADVFDTRQNWKYDLVNCLDGVDGVIGTTSLFVKAADVMSLVGANYTFNAAEVCVGDLAVSQVSITYKAQPDSESLTFSELKLAYDGNLKPVVIKRETSSSPPPSTSSTQLINLQGKLQDRTIAPTSKSFLQGSADLTFSPGQTKVFEISSILRDSGTAKVQSLTVGIEGQGFEVDFMLSFDDVDSSDSQKLGGAGNALWWEEAEDGGSIKKVAMRLDSPRSLVILPKPPKMDLDIEKLADPLYLDEPVKVKIKITNNEEEEAVARLRIRILGYPDEVPLVHWDPVDGTDDVECDPETPYEIGNVAPSQKLFRAFTFPAPVQEADVTLEIAALYHLVTDTETPIVKTVLVPQVRVRQPFKAKYDFSQSIHFSPWPNYFTLSDEDLDGEGDESSPKGIVQKWCLKSAFALMEGGGLTVEDIFCDVVACQGGIMCTVIKPEESSAEGNTWPMALEGDKPMDSTFYLDVRKVSLEDRRASSLDIEIRIKWRRQGASEPVQTALAIPRLMIPGSEPRVLAHSTPSPQLPSVLLLTYIIENPTMHVLTFGVTMEANDGFAFSGPKQLGIQLMPLSRHSIRYNLMPLQRNVWIRPSIRVVDKYYNKNLRIAACEGTRPDKGQVLVWVP